MVIRKMCRTRKTGKTAWDIVVPKKVSTIPFQKKKQAKDEQNRKPIKVYELIKIEASREKGYGTFYMKN